MDKHRDLNNITDFLCVEPEVGEAILPLYPEFLSPEKKAVFEIHLKGCDACQKWWNFWQSSGVALRIEALVNRSVHLLQDRCYDEAIETYNNAMELQPTLTQTDEGQQFFLSDAWFSMTTATSPKKNLLPYIFPSYTPGEYEVSAATPEPPFPILLEYAEGQVKGKIFTAGTSVFFEVFEAQGNFSEKVILVGQIFQPTSSLKVWEIIPGKKHRLGTIASLFGAQDLQHVTNALRTFKVFTTVS